MWWASTTNSTLISWSLRPTITTTTTTPTTTQLLPVTVSATSIPSRTPKPLKNQAQKENSKTNQLSGLDVLWAMKKATVEKNKKKKKRRKNSVSGESDREGEEEEEEAAIDYSKVEPLCIKNEWSARLDELDKRLMELSDTK